MKYEFHLSHLAHFSHDCVEVSYEDFPFGNTRVSGGFKIGLRGVNPAKIELREPYDYGTHRSLVRMVFNAVRADRSFIPALLRAKQAEIEKELASAQRKVEKLLEARDRIRLFTAE